MQRLVTVLAVLFVVQPQVAAAYIDPNTGGLLFQLLAPLLAMITSAWLLARDYIMASWRRLWRRGREADGGIAPTESRQA